MPEPVQQARNYRIKVAMVGDSGVGKRTLAKLATTNVLDDRLLDQIGVNFTFSNVKLSGKKGTIHAKVIFWDITGTLRAGRLRDKYEKGIRGLVVVADASRPDSIEHVPLWITNINNRIRDLEMVLVLNKIDLVDEAGLDNARARMTMFADTFDAPLFMTSCKIKQDLDKPFLEISRRVCEHVLAEYDLPSSGQMRGNR